MKHSIIKTVLLTVATLLIISSCSIDNDYNLKKELDTKINVGQQILLPIGDYPTIKIGGLLSKDASDVFVKNEEGDYVTNTGGVVLKNFVFGHYELSGLSIINLKDFGIPEIKFYIDLKNTLPFAYSVTAFVIDSLGNRIESVVAIIDATLPKGSSEAPSFTSSILTISPNMTEEGLGFDGFKIELKALEIPATPITIPHGNGLALKNVRVQLPEGINLTIKKKKQEES